MSKETQKVYKKMIDQATREITISISRAAYDITAQVHDDLMRSVRDEINKYLERRGVE